MSAILSDPTIWYERQNVAHRELSRLINKGKGVKSTAVVEAYRNLNSLETPGSIMKRSIHIEAYQGHNPFVERLQQYLKKTLQEDVLTVLVHGSIGSYEEIPYSDFDALVILKEDVFSSASRLKRIALELRRALTLMYAYDPLQHHGWFVLSELDLKALCEAYFPCVLFEKAKSIYPTYDFELQVNSRYSQQEVIEQFKGLLDSITRMLDSGSYANNLYMLKCLLSQFMLLPAMYLQLKVGRGVWKGDSFDMAKPDFSVKAWQAMDHASRIRYRWAYSLSPIRKAAITQAGWLGDKLRKTCSPPIPKELQALLSPEFISNMYTFLKEVRESKPALLNI